MAGLAASRRNDPRQEPGAVVPPARICAGAARKGRPYRDRLRPKVGDTTSQRTDKGRKRMSEASTSKEQRIAELAEVFRRLGADDPQSWAKSEIEENIPQRPCTSKVDGLRQEEKFLKHLL